MLAWARLASRARQTPASRGSQLRDAGEDGWEDGARPDLTLGQASHLLAKSLEIEARQPNFNVIPYPEDEGGFLTTDVIEQRSGELDGKDIMICGSAD
jgi:hypothetical protein